MSGGWRDMTVSEALTWLRVRIYTLLLVLKLIEDRPEPESITCPQCGRTSFHPVDVRERYCGACHRFHDQMLCPQPADDGWPCTRRNGHGGDHWCAVKPG